MRKENTSLIKDIIGSSNKLRTIRAIIIFGSVARDQDTSVSDVDICVVADKKNRYQNKIISNIFLELGKKHNRDIQLIICDKKFKRVERQFLETILREGKVILGRIPPIPIQRLQLEPYSIIKYEMKNLKHSDKMRLTRLLYGKETKKRYKGKIYLSQKKGLLAKLKGIRAGKSSILLPEKQSWILEGKLSELRVKTKRIYAWLQKI